MEGEITEEGAADEIARVGRNARCGKVEDCVGENQQGDKSGRKAGRDDGAEGGKLAVFIAEDGRNIGKLFETWINALFKRR